MSVAERLIVLDASVAVAWHVHQSPQLTRYAGAVADLADRLDAPLATYDKALIAACRQFKIKHYQPD